MTTHRSLGFFLLVPAILGCSPGGREQPADAPPRPPDAPPPDATVDAEPPPDARVDAVPVSCGDLELPTSAVPVTVMPGFVASEDLAFDDAGNLVENDTVNLYKTTYEGARTTFVAGLDFRAGMRMTSTGKLVVDDNHEGRIVRVDPDGSQHTIMTGLSYPNGMEIDDHDFVYFTDQSQNRVVRIDPETGVNTTLTTLVDQPNGLSFSPDYSTLYIGAFSGVGTIYAIDLDDDGNPSNFRAWKENVGTGWLDGMGVDACGNVYVADYGQSKILRINADASGTPMAIVDQSAGFTYMPNFQWGSGLGGWDEHLLYIISVGGGLLVADVGVDSKPRP
jgi:hypothetical protein